MTDERRCELLERCQKQMFVTLSEEHLRAGMSDRGGWIAEQFALFGIDWPPRAGWKRGLVGRRVPGSTVAAFILRRRVRDAGGQTLFETH